MAKRKRLAVAAGLVALCLMMTACGSDDELMAVEDETGNSTVGIVTKKESATSEESETTETETAEEETNSEPTDGFEETSEEDAEAIRQSVVKALEAYRTADMDGIVKYTAMELYYYAQFGKPSASEEELKTALQENGYIISPMTEDEVQFEIDEIYRLPSAEDTGLYTYLTSTLETCRETEDKADLPSEAFDVPPYEEVREVYNITDVGMARVKGVYGDSKTAKSQAVESATYCYVFQIDGQWKLDFMYTTSYHAYLLNEGLKRVESEA